MKRLLIITQKVDEDDQLLGFFTAWINLFAQTFDRVTVLCLEKGRYILPKNVEVVSLGKDQKQPKHMWLFNFYKYIFKKRKSYDSVFVHMNPIWALLGGVCWRIMRKRICLWYTHKSITLKLRLAEKFVDLICTASPESFRLPSKKVIVTGHGIDTTLFAPSEKRPARQSGGKTKNEKLLTVGRIAPVKNYEVLIEAVKILKEKGIDFSVTIVGAPALEQDREYEKRICVKSTGLNFQFLGKKSQGELPDIYRSHDLFVHMSETGSLDKTLLEAMACGMRVVSCNDAAKRFLPRAWIFEYDEPDDLALKIEKNNMIDFDTRQYVTEHHELKKLIARISAIL